MPIAANTRFGPYEIIAPIGAGGMGEVYRARDTRLGREVAIKVLPAAFAADADRLRRFEQEARATAALNHPNILAVYDIGTCERSPYVVSELLEGETLRQQLQSGALATRKALEMAQQVVSGLAAAHDKGIIHRDLKPENLFITRDGRLKILDFGLAKLTEPQAALGSMAVTAEGATDPGTVLGTMGYMSPEQVRGQATDARSDIFSFGAILYEMLSGKRAFHGATSADTISAILKEDPPDLVETNRTVSPALERIVRHCMAKNPEQRFHSARDIGFALEGLSTASSAPLPAVGEESPKPGVRWIAPLAIACAALAGVLAIGRYSAPVGNVASAVPDIHQLTFGNGYITSAGFSPDGQTIIYAAAWAGKPEEIFATSAKSPESRSLELKNAILLAVSSEGQMAVKLHPNTFGAFARPGTLATLPLTGGAPRELLNDVEAADFSTDGSQLAVVQRVNGQFSLQYPVGKVLFTSPLWISHPRISPNGTRVAFLNHPFGGDEGSVMVAEKSGTVRELSSGWLTLQGLAWSPDGKELWFSGTRVGLNRALYAVTLEGKERVVLRVPGQVTLRELSPSGQALISEAFDHLMLRGKVSGAADERDLSVFDAGVPAALSLDGKMLLMTEVGEAGGQGYSVYLRPTDGSPATRLGEGLACDLSGDGKLALSRTFTKPAKLLLLPTLGAPQEIATGNIEPGCGHFVPGGKNIVFTGEEADHKAGLYLLELSAGAVPKLIARILAADPLSPAVTKDGKFALAPDASGKFWFYPIAGGEARPALGLLPDDSIAGAGSGSTLYVYHQSAPPQVIFELDAATGQRRPWKELGPADRSGATNTFFAVVAPDGNSYAYTYDRILSELYLVKGLK